MAQESRQPAAVADGRAIAAADLAADRRSDQSGDGEDRPSPHGSADHQRDCSPGITPRSRRPSSWHTGRSGRRSSSRARSTSWPSTTSWSPSDRTRAGVPLRLPALPGRLCVGALRRDPALGFCAGVRKCDHGIPANLRSGVCIGRSLLNGGARTESTSYSHSVSASLSRLAGRHTLKAGGDYRLIGMRVFAPGDVNGSFAFTSAFTQGPEPERRRHGCRRRGGQPAARDFPRAARSTSGLPMTCTRTTSPATSRTISGCGPTSASTSACATSSNRA